MGTRIDIIKLLLFYTWKNERENESNIERVFGESWDYEWRLSDWWKEMVNKNILQDDSRKRVLRENEREEKRSNCKITWNKWKAIEKASESTFYWIRKNMGIQTILVVWLYEDFIVYKEENKKDWVNYIYAWSVRDLFWIKFDEIIDNFTNKVWDFMDRSRLNMVYKTAKIQVDWGGILKHY